MRFIRNIGMILGSALFFAVSCTFGSFVVVPIITKKEVEKGEQLHPWFSVVAEPGENGLPFRVIGKDQLESQIYHNNESDNPIKSEYDSISVSFLMSKPTGHIETDYQTFYYKVIEDFGDEQLIELEEKYEVVDAIIWSRYKAQQTSISPLSTRVFSARLAMFFGFPIALGSSLVLLLIGRVLLRITRSKSVAKVNS